MSVIPAENQLVTLLHARHLSLATAESCTGGLIGHRITNVAGASLVYRGGVVAYGNEVKTGLLGVDRETLLQQGAVSEAVARQLAEGARRALRADWGIGVTGIAGPGGASAEKPVGLVYIGVAGPDGTRVARHLFEGGRGDIKAQSAEAALNMLLEEVQ